MPHNLIICLLFAKFRMYMCKKKVNFSKLNKVRNIEKNSCVIHSCFKTSGNWENKKKGNCEVLRLSQSENFVNFFCQTFIKLQSNFYQATIKFISSYNQSYIKFESKLYQVQSKLYQVTIKIIFLRHRGSKLV